MSLVRTRLRRLVCFVLVMLTSGSGWLVASPAAAASKTSVTVFLKPPNAVALAKLARRHGLSHEQRVRAVERLLPTANERSTAVHALVDDGFTLTTQTAWSVTATGSTSTVEDRFGSRPSLPPHASTARRRAAAGAYPRLPSRLQKVASAAYPTDSGPAAFQPSSLDGADFRNAYTSPALTAAGTPPYDGTGSPDTLTIATIQLAGWNSSDLTTYAADSGLTFNPTTDLTQVPVDQATVPPASSSDTGDIEVDLDQETILSTDPDAHQRAYFAKNNPAGFADSFSQVLDDVLQTPDAVDGGDPAIAALSVSWGSCEDQTGTKEIKNTLEPIMQSLLAAGVTIFASTGDKGIYDCSSGGTGVDYPASSPEVVGVGGTTLDAADAPAPNDGSNWNETAWSCNGQLSCTSSGSGNGGSGGGVSSVFRAPSYQTAGITDAPFAGAKHRLVPDISADANPATGFEIYTTDPTKTAKKGHRFPVGGTSLATPVSAALFTNALAAHGVTAGVGNIHPALYDAHLAGDGAFRDVTSGRNGATGAAPDDPAVEARSGYDTVTGLGGALWPAVVDEIFAVGSDVAPTLTASVTLARPHSSKRWRVITARWSGARSSGGTAVTNVAVAVVRAGHPGATYQMSGAAAHGTHSFIGKPGATYVLYARATDQGGAVSAARVASVVVPIDDRSFKMHGRWHRLSVPAAIGGSIEVAHHAGAYARVTATGRIYNLVVRKGPKYGKLAVYLGKRRVKTVNLHRASARPKVIRIYGSRRSADISRTFTFRALGHPRNTRVDVDALYARL